MEFSESFSSLLNLTKKYAAHCMRQILLAYQMMAIFYKYKMGCSAIKSKPESSYTRQIRKKLRTSIYPLSTLHSLSTISALASRENSATHYHCLKIKILPMNPKMCFKRLDLKSTQLFRQSLEILPIFEEIKRIYADFTMLYRNFCNRAHESCIENFDISDGIFIMMVSIFANKPCKLVFTNSAPFFQLEGSICSDTKEIVTDWINFSNFLEVVLIEKSNKIEVSVERLKGFLNLMQEYVEFSLRPSIIEKAISKVTSSILASEAMITEVQKLTTSASLFFNKIKSNHKDIERLGNIASDLKIFRGEQILHYVLKDSKLKN